jgi:hypothetical protein
MLEDLGESDEAIPIPNVSLICTPFLSVAPSILTLSFFAGQRGGAEEGH